MHIPMSSLPGCRAFAFMVLLLLCVTTRAAQVIPFEYLDGLIWVKVKTASGEVPLNFLLDSGAGKSVLNLETANRLGIQLGASVKVQCVKNMASARRVEVFHATVSGVSIPQNPLALDLSETSELCSRSIDGLLGQDFLRGRIVQIDFKAGRIRLLEAADDSNCCAVVSLMMRNDAMCVPVSMNGSRPKWARIDTGCEDALHWVGGRNGTSMQTSVQVGEETITDVKTAMHRSAIFPSESGLLGNGVLSNYRITIDAVNLRLLLEKS